MSWSVKFVPHLYKFDPSALAKKFLLNKLNSTSSSELTSQYIWFLLWNGGHDLAVGVVLINWKVLHKSASRSRCCCNKLAWLVWLWGSIINRLIFWKIRWIAGCMCFAYLCGWSLWPQAGTLSKSPWDVEFIFMALDPGPRAYWFKIIYGCIAWKHLILRRRRLSAFGDLSLKLVYFICCISYIDQTALEVFARSALRRPNRLRHWHQQGQHRRLFQGRLNKLQFWACQWVGCFSVVGLGCE
jgi:hypothetical protein